MSAFRSDEAALSETVGALLLVLIVLSAATSFALFVQTEQNDAQERALRETQREGERLEVLALQPELDGATDTWKSLNFTVANLDVERAKVADVSVNDQPLQQYTVWRWNEVAGTLEAVVMQGTWELNLSARERVYLNISVPADFYGTVSLDIDAFVKLDLLSGRLKTYTRAFVPPTAIGLVEVTERWDSVSADYVPIVLLDGRQSDHPDPVALIIAWSWLVNETGPDTRTYTGRYVRTDFVPGVPYTIELTVTDDTGMMARDAFAYTP